MDQNKQTVAPELPTGKTSHAELEAQGWEFPNDMKGRKGQVGYFKVDGKIVATCRITNQRFVESI